MGSGVRTTAAGGAGERRDRERTRRLDRRRPTRVRHRSRRRGGGCRGVKPCGFAGSHGQGVTEGARSAGYPWANRADPCKRAGGQRGQVDCFFRAAVRSATPGRTRRVRSRTPGRRAISRRSSRRAWGTDAGSSSVTIRSSPRWSVLRATRAGVRIVGTAVGKTSDAQGSGERSSAVDASSASASCEDRENHLGAVDQHREPPGSDVTRRPVRSSSSTPASRSRADSCCETADGVVGQRLGNGGDGPAWASSRRRRSLRTSSISSAYARLNETRTRSETADCSER